MILNITNAAEVLNNPSELEGVPLIVKFTKSGVVAE